MKRIVFLAASCALIAACSDNSPTDADGDGEVSAEEMAVAAEKADIKPEAGLYRATSSVVTIEMPGAPEGMVEMMRGGMDNRKSEFCMTQEDADKGFEKMAKESQDDNCTVDSFDISGGDVDAKMTCKGAGQDGMSITLDGTGTSTTMDMTISMEGKLPEIGDAKMVIRTKQERIGDCP